MTSSLWMRDAYRAPATLQLQQLSSTTSAVCFLFAGIKQASRLCIWKKLSHRIVPQACTASNFSYHSEAALARRDRADHWPAVARHRETQEMLSVPQGHPRWALRVEHSRKIRRVVWAVIVQHLNAAKLAMFFLLPHAKQDRAGENVCGLREEKTSMIEWRMKSDATSVTDPMAPGRFHETDG